MNRRSPMRVPPVSFLLCAALFAAIPVAAEQPLSRTDKVLWTMCTITLHDHASAQILDECFARLREIDSRMSTNTPGSQLDAVSAQAGKAPVKVTDDVLFVAKKALTMAAISDGLFDPTVGPLMKVWKLEGDHPDVPQQADIDAARKLVNWRDVVLDESAKTIFLRRPSMRLDFGALVKGYAADEVARILGERGVKSAIVDLGGDILAVGSSPSNVPWRIGVQNPESERGESLGVALVTNQAVVTSGVYEHFFIKNGKRYHHIMDTRTGYPVDNGLTSVTVVTPRSVDADGFGLLLFCEGTKEGLKLGEKLGLGVIMVDAQHRVYLTPQARGYFSLTNSEFTLAN
ncbi:MAG: FAD:protein FMN transferase [Spirochaetia bacterium]